MEVPREVHPFDITDHAVKEKHTIHVDWEGVTFPTRDTDWTARRVKEAVRDQKDKSPLHDQ